MKSKMTLLAAGLCLAASPAFAGDLTPADETGPMLLSDTEMDSVVGGTVIVLRRYLQINSNGKQIEMPDQGAQKMLSSEGPADNNGTTPFTDFDITPPGFPIPGATLTADATFVGTPSNGRGAGFITIKLNLP